MKKLFVPVLALVLLFLSSCAVSPATNAVELTSNPNGTQASQPTGAEALSALQPPAPEPEPQPEAGCTLVTDRHIPYLSGSEGMFHPDESISRAEAAQMLTRLVPEEACAAVTPKRFTDVKAEDWYAGAAGVMGGLGVIRAREAEFLPEEKICRAEFVDYVSKFFLPRTDAWDFADVPAGHPYYQGVRTARAYGWVGGYDGNQFLPDDEVTRAEAVKILNRALGRSADTAYVDGSGDLVLYMDLDPDFWGYYDIMEASVEHGFTPDGIGAEKWTSHTVRPLDLEGGLYARCGWLFYFDAEAGRFARNETVGNFTFDGSGHFTSGNEELDGYLHTIVLEHVNDEMTREEKLKAVYDYTRDSFKYFRRPAYELGVMDYMETDALRMLTSGYGNCYCYSSLFWYLARWVGYDAVINSGTVGNGRLAPHSWVEIEFDGTNYVYDTELEMSYIYERGQPELKNYFYHMKPSVRRDWNYITHGTAAC